MKAEWPVQRLWGREDEKSWYSTADAARRLGLSKRETLHLIKVGETKAIWIGGSAADEAKQAVEELFTLL